MIRDLLGMTSGYTYGGDSRCRTSDDLEAFPGNRFAYGKKSVNDDGIHGQAGRNTALSSPAHLSNTAYPQISWVLSWRPFRSEIQFIS